MRKIPNELCEEMANDPYYKKCCVTGWTHEKIDWHHNLIYAGKQVNEKWCILPLARSIHERITDYQEECDRIMLNRATDEELERYSKVIPYKVMRDRLNAV